MSTGIDLDALANALAAQRHVLEHKRHLLDQAIRAISEAEQLARVGQRTDPGIYRRIIEVIEMQHDTQKWKETFETLLTTKSTSIC